MKTLDEVIDNFEKACDLERRCEGCSGCLGQEYGCPNDGAESVPDALKYLKKLKRVEAKIEKIALGNIEDTLSKMDNPPLTWDELRQMEGKPVWVECDYFFRPQWVILTNVCDEKAMFVGDRIFDSELKEEMGDVWQAYRKERK